MSTVDVCDLYFLISNTRSIVAKTTYRDKPNWVLVKDMFGCGSTRARDICIMNDIDPEGFIVQKIVKRTQQ